MRRTEKGFIRAIRTSTRTYTEADQLDTPDGQASEIWNMELHKEGATITLYPTSTWQSRNKETTRIWIPTHEIKKVVFTSEMTEEEAQEWEEIGGDETLQSNLDAYKERERERAKQTKKENTK